MKYLIVNADDFGYSFGVNKGIIKAHTNGIVTSTSLLVDGIASAAAADLAQYNELSIGLHFFVKDTDDIVAELKRQVDAFVKIVGKLPDHIDTHKRRSTDPLVKDVLNDFAMSNSIPVRALSRAKNINSFFGDINQDNISIQGFMRALDEATDEYNELMCHVGYADEYLLEHSSYNTAREIELATLTNPIARQYLEAEKGLTLCSWRQLKIIKQ